MSLSCRRAWRNCGDPTPDVKLVVPSPQTYLHSRAQMMDRTADCSPIETCVIFAVFGLAAGSRSFSLHAACPRPFHAEDGAPAAFLVAADASSDKDALAEAVGNLVTFRRGAVPTVAL